jgi:hypothetical protein
MPVIFNPEIIKLTIIKFSISDMTGVKEWGGLYSTSFNPNISQNQVEVIQTIARTGIADGVETKIIELAVQAVFRVPQVFDFWGLPRPRLLLKRILAGILFSTCRGIILDRTSHTHLDQDETLLPIVDPGELFVPDDDERAAISEDLSKQS